MTRPAPNRCVGWLIVSSCYDLEPIGHAPFAITNWEPDSDTQPEPDTRGGERTAPPAAG